MAAPTKRSRSNTQWCSAINCTNNRRKSPLLSFSRFPKDPERTFQKECPFVIRVRTNNEGTALYVKSIIDEHNHDINEVAFAHLPHQRKLSDAEKEKAAEVLKMKANKKLVQEKLMTEIGKIVTLKDLHNIGAIATPSDDLTSLIDEMRQIPDATVELVIGSDDQTLKGIYFQREEWRQMYSRYPEILFLDATYKLNNLRMPLYVMLCEDGNGESEIVCLWFVSMEDRDTISQMMRIFKSYNTTANTKCVMTDKDLVERDVITQELPDAKLLICLFHVLRSMKRELTTEKMGIAIITNAQRLSALNILQQIAHARSAMEYEEKYSLLQQTKIRSVIDYYDRNWHDIRFEWVDGLRNHVTHFANRTNNRLEAINQKIKSVVTRFSSIPVCFSELMSCISSLSVERDHRAISCFQKTAIYSGDPDLKPFRDVLTPYAFAFVKKQFSLLSSVSALDVDTVTQTCTFHSNRHTDLQTTKHTCTCGIPESIALPCRHIFALRRALGVPIFDPECVAARWTLQYYRQSHRVFSTSSFPCSAAPSISVVEQSIRPSAILTQHQKFRRASCITQQLAVLASEHSSREFDQALGCLSSILDAWQNKQRVVVHVVIDEDDPPFPASVMTETQGSCAIPVTAVDGPMLSVATAGQGTEESESVPETIPEHEVVQILAELAADAASDNEGDVDGDSNPGLAPVETEIEDSSSAIPCAATEESSFSVEPEGSSMASCQPSISSVDLSSIRLPCKRKVRGRAKGACLTVIGLPKKRKVQITKPIPFCKRSENEKEHLILSWILSPQAMAKVNNGELLGSNDLPTSISDMDVSILDDHVNWPVIEKYFTVKSWQVLCRLKGRFERLAVWLCCVCSIDLASQSSIVCEVCLKWYHLPCAGLSSKPKIKLWVCRNCMKNTII